MKTLIKVIMEFLLSLVEIIQEFNPIIRMDLKAAAVGAAVEAGVQTVVSEAYREGKSKRNHEDLMQKAGKLWKLRNEIREGRSQKRLRKDIEWIVKGASLSKDMVEMCEQVHSLWEEECLKRKVRRELPNSVEVIPPSKIEHKSSLHKYVEEALSFLEDPEIRRIGIWGNVGAGKTTIMKHLNHHVNIYRMFDIVIWLTVPKEWSVVGFQQKIMDRLKLDMGSATDIEKNAQIIFEELKRKKKCLILLDDICHGIELEKIIGVHDMCKVVLASRDRGICRDMDVDQLINVKPLSDDEALKMFKEKDGRRSLQIWLNKEGKDEVLELLEFCYNSLDSDAKKDYSYRCLLECWRLEGFIRNDGHEILSHLIDVSLLESSGNKKSVKMNKPSEGLKEPPNLEEWKQVHRISLMDNELHSLPETPDCRDLLTLLLQRNENLIAIPKLFFTSMCCLEGLYLNSCNHLVGLPTDIEALKQLEVLDIRATKLSLCRIRTLTWLKLLRVSLSNFGREAVLRINQDMFQAFAMPRVLCQLQPSMGRFLYQDQPSVEDVYFTFRFVVGYQKLTCFQILESFDDPGYNCLKFINGEGMNDAIRKVNNVLELESIWQGPVHAGSLTRLRTLTLVKCPQLKRIFSNGMIQQLSKLEDLRVEECDQIEEVIMESENNGLESNQLPRLKTLTLLNLPRLRSIWVDDSLEWRSLQTIEISTCHLLKKLPFNNVNATKLRSIKGQRAWWEALEWKDDGAIKQRLESLCIFN
ncbi:hypothetical protein AAG906_003753 [Vitis piasezkii]